MESCGLCYHPTPLPTSSRIANSNLNNSVKPFFQPNVLFPIESVKSSKVSNFFVSAKKPVLCLNAKRNDLEEEGYLALEKVQKEPSFLPINRRELILGSTFVLSTANQSLADELENKPLSNSENVISEASETSSTDSSSQNPPSETPSPPEKAEPEQSSELSPSPSPSPSTDSLPSEKKSPDTTITDRVFFDFSLCPNAARTDRTLGDTSLICTDGEPLGRVVIGLYGKQVPRTVENFKSMVTGKAGSTYKLSVVHKILQGQYIQIGRQGSSDRGEILPPKSLERNSETVLPGSFKLKHNKPGVVSLCLSENDDNEARKLSPEFRNVEFMITTGPGPAPQLDNNNVVFGIVLEGIDVISNIASVPTYRPSERIRQFNDLAEFLGDERASNARNLWNTPLRSVVISNCDVIDISLPPLPPYMP